MVNCKACKYCGKTSMIGGGVQLLPDIKEENYLEIDYCKIRTLEDRLYLNKPFTYFIYDTLRDCNLYDQIE